MFIGILVDLVYKASWQSWAVSSLVHEGSNAILGIIFAFLLSDDLMVLLIEGVDVENQALMTARLHRGIAFTHLGLELLHLVDALGWSPEAHLAPVATSDTLPAEAIGPWSEERGQALRKGPCWLFLLFLDLIIQQILLLRVIRLLLLLVFGDIVLRTASVSLGLLFQLLGINSEVGIHLKVGHNRWWLS